MKEKERQEGTAAQDTVRFDDHMTFRDEKYAYCAGEIEVPSYTDDRGTCTVLECGKEVSFPIKRVFFLHKCVKPRGQHETTCDYVVLPVRGSVVVHLKKGDEDLGKIKLLAGRKALSVRKGTWIEIKSFKNAAICMVLCSDFYGEQSYGRNFPDPWKD